MRTIIDLPPDQIERLANFCAREHISRAEAVRRAVAALLDDEKERAFKAAFGAWKHLGIDGLEYQRQIRAEWDREWDPD